MGGIYGCGCKEVHIKISSLLIRTPLVSVLFCNILSGMSKDLLMLEMEDICLDSLLKEACFGKGLGPYKGVSLFSVASFRKIGVSVCLI